MHTGIHRYNLLSVSSGQNAHYHSTTLRLVQNVGTTTNCAAPHPRTSTQTEERERRVFRICGLEEESAGSEWEMFEKNMDCTVLWPQGETKVGSYRHVLVENNKKSPKNHRAYVPKRFRPRKKASKSSIMHLGQDTPTSNTTQLWRSINISI